MVRSAADDQPAADNEAEPAPRRRRPSSRAPIAWSGDVSPALRDRTAGKAATTIRVHHGAKDVEEVKF